MLRIALEQHLRFAPPDSKFVIVDDNSNNNNEEIASTFIQATGAQFRYSPTRLGIAKAKNACLSQIADCDHIFLFDDDAWPKAPNWADSWANCSEEDNIGHSMFIDSTNNLDNKDQNVHILPIGTFKHFTSWNNCLGVALHFSNKCISSIGGYDHIRAINVYGYEHAQMSHRATKAGFTNGLQYLSPTNCKDLIFSFDISYMWKNELPDIQSPMPTAFASSVTHEEAVKHVLNSDLMYIEDAHVPLIDPLA